MEAKNDDKGLEKLLDRLHNWSVLKISEQLNNRELKTKLSDKLLRAILGRFGYKGKIAVKIMLHLVAHLTHCDRNFSREYVYLVGRYRWLYLRWHL